MKIARKPTPQLFTIPLHRAPFNKTKEILGELISLKEMPSDYFFLHYNYEFKDWCLCEMELGMLLIRGGSSRQDIIKKAEQILHEHKHRWEEIKKQFIENKAFDFIPPVNEFE